MSVGSHICRTQIQTDVLSHEKDGDVGGRFYDYAVQTGINQNKIFPFDHHVC